MSDNDHSKRKQLDDELIFKREPSDHDSQSKYIGPCEIESFPSSGKITDNFEERKKRLKTEIKAVVKVLDPNIDTVIEVTCVSRDAASVALYKANGNILDAVENILADASTGNALSPNLAKGNIDTLDERENASAQNVISPAWRPPLYESNLPFNQPGTPARSPSLHLPTNPSLIPPSPTLNTNARRVRRQPSSFDRIRRQHLRGMHMNFSFCKRVAKYEDDYLTAKLSELRFVSRSHDDDSSSDKELHPMRTAPKCQICNDTVTNNFTLSCNHPFCMTCLNQYIQAQIELGNAACIICPMPRSECGSQIPQSELQTILGREKFTKLDRFALESATDTDPNFHHCPTPDCPYIVYWEAEDGSEDGTPITTTPKLFCPICDSTACLKCSVTPYHEGISCEAFQSMPPSSQNEQLTASYFEQNKKNMRECRRCGTLVAKKEGGCLKMKCRCGYRFCFECGVENATCGHTPSHHGFTDNITGRGDFVDLKSLKSPT